MGFITRLFAPDYDFEKSRAKWLDEQLTLSLNREKLKDAKIASLYTRIEKILLRYGDMASLMAGRKGMFVADAEEVKEVPDEIVYSADEMAKFRHYAEMMRESALEMAETELEKERVPSVDDFILEIQKNPEYVFV